MTYATGDLLHVRRRRDPPSRYRRVLRTLAVATASVAVVLFSIAAIVVGIGRTSSAFIQAQSGTRPIASLAAPPVQLARADTAGAIGTRWPVIADLVPVSPTITVASVPAPQAPRVAVVETSISAPVKIQDRLAAIRSDKPPVAQASASADPDITGSLGNSAPKLATADVASIGLARMPPARADASPAPLPQPRPRFAALPPAADPGAGPGEDSHTVRTAIYDITAQVVYLPNGERLEAHSGLGDFMDNPRHVRQKNRGPTPPNTYNLKLREALFHGVQAIRMTPVDEGSMFNRDGILAHSYMLGPNGQSNGCVSFKDYPKFLRAFLRGEVDRIVVVARLDTPPKFYARTNSRTNSRTASNTFNAF
jgi:hypothetical protein